MKSLDNFEKLVVGKVKAVMDKITEFFVSDEFAPQRNRIAEGILAAIDIALVGSVALAKIGFKVGEAIFNGFADVARERFPTFAKAIGLGESERLVKQRGERKRLVADAVQAADFIKRFGLEETRRVFSNDVIKRAQRLNAFTDTSIDFNKKPTGTQDIAQRAGCQSKRGTSNITR